MEPSVVLGLVLWLGISMGGPWIACHQHLALGGRLDGELIMLLAATHGHLWKVGGQHVELCDGCPTEEAASFP